MNKILLPLVFLSVLFSLLATSLSAQDDRSRNPEYQAVILNYDKSCFGNNQALPVGKYFVINGAVRSDISYVEALLYSAGRAEKGYPLFQGSWRRNVDGPRAALFNIPMNHQLIGNAEYDVVIQYFRETTPQERSAVKADMIRLMDSYVDQSLEAIFARSTPDDRTNQMVGDMNNIARKGLAFYRNRQGIVFKAFSELAKGKLRQLMAAHPAGSTKNGVDNATSAKRRALLTTEFKTLIHGELEAYLNVDLFALADRLPIRNYPTERLKNPIGLNIGLAAALIDMNATPANYGFAPYVGISYPIAANSKSSILRTATLGGGLFMTGVRDANGDTYTGPLLRAPAYLAVGIKPFPYIRLQAGTAFLNYTYADGRTVTAVRPMIGLALEFDFSLNNKNGLEKSTDPNKD